MAGCSWKTPESSRKIWCLLDAVETLRITKPVIGAFYVTLLEEEEYTVKLPHLEWIAFYTEDALPVYCDYLDIALVRRRECPLTHDIILEMITSLFRTVDKSCRCTKSCNKLLTIARNLGYADIIWLYASSLMNLGNKQIHVRLHKEGDTSTTDLLLDYLYRQKESMICIVTRARTYELRTVTLFRSIVSLLLRENRNNRAIEAYRYMQREIGLTDPLFYLRDHALSMPKEHKAFIECLSSPTCNA